MANVSSDEEPDYMSEEFLKQCTANDVRPSLLHSRADKRQHEVLKRKCQVNKTKADKEKDMFKSLEEGLKVPISEESKGFKMLQKMGYKPGSSIGRETNDPSRRGITVPIEVELKKGRGGLGKEQHELEIQKKKLNLGNPEEFRLRQQNAVLAREIMLDLKKAQFACHNLDAESDKQEPVEPWYWPKLNPTVKKVETESEDEDEESMPVPNKKQCREVDDESSSSSDNEDEIPNEDKLETIRAYLRKQHMYCLWCATRFENETDMVNSCPGTTKDEH